MRVTSKIAIVLASVVAAASITGVSATWYYEKAVSVTKEVEVEVGDWDQTNLLLNTIIKELNNSSSDLNYNIDYRENGNWLSSIFGDFGARDFYGSMDGQVGHTTRIGFFTYTYDLKDEYILSENTSNLSYIVQTANDDDTQKYVYICDVYLGESGTLNSKLTGGTETAGNPTIPIGENIYHVYRTTLTRADTSSDWSAVENETMIDRYAPSCWYREMREWTPLDRQTPSYDIYNWTAGTCGTSESTAIWTFDGDSTTATATNNYYKMQIASVTYYYSYDIDSDEFTYYKTTQTNNASSHSYSYNEAGTYTITSDSGVTITIYEGSVNSSEVVSGTGSVIFTADAATTYYIVLSGATEMSLNVGLSS